MEQGVECRPIPDLHQTIGLASDHGMGAGGVVALALEVIQVAAIVDPLCGAAIDHRVTHIDRMGIAHIADRQVRVVVMPLRPRWAPLLCRNGTRHGHANGDRNRWEYRVHDSWPWWVE